MVPGDSDIEQHSTLLMSSCSTLPEYTTSSELLTLLYYYLLILKLSDNLVEPTCYYIAITNLNNSFNAIIVSQIFLKCIDAGRIKFISLSVLNSCYN